MSRFITKVVVIAVVIGVLLAMAGVLHFRNDTDQTSVTIDKKELKDKAQDVVGKTEEAGGKILDKTSTALHKAAEGLRDRPTIGKPRNRRRPATRARDNDVTVSRRKFICLRWLTAEV